MRRLALCALLALAALGVGGAVDLWYGIQARADLGGTEPARIREVLELDPDTDIVETMFVTNGVHVVCSGRGTIANVEATRSGSVVVSVGEINRHPSAEELADWNRLVDDICARIDDTCPGIGAWDRTREPERGGGWICLAVTVGFFVVLTVGAAGAVTGIVLLIQRLRRGSPTDRK